MSYIILFFKAFSCTLGRILFEIEFLCSSISSILINFDNSPRTKTEVSFLVYEEITDQRKYRLDVDYYQI
jgi:hypothetical protein